MSMIAGEFCRARATVLVILLCLVRKWVVAQAVGPLKRGSDIEIHLELLPHRPRADALQHSS